MGTRTREILVVVAVAWLCSLLFWSGLYQGEGLIGGDVYSYSLPQKVFLADQLELGVIPLWNPYVGQGYPVIAESQTAALYPLHLLLFAVCDVQTAWNAVLILHYLAAFAAAYWCSRWLGLQLAGGLLMALVYVYGWFPVRAFLDWAILGGVYLPLTLGCLAAYLKSRRFGYLLGLAISIGMQLLGGHFQLAFLTWLLIFSYSLWNGWRCDSGLIPNRTWIWLSGAMLLGIGLAAVQLLPTWELKSRSQRATVGVDHDPGYGHIPPIYLSQLAMPGIWYAQDLDLDTALSRLTYLSIASGTNRVEAHLYFGQVPFYLVLGSLVVMLRQRAIDRDGLFWWLVVVISIVYATGWLMIVLQYVPGFNYFRGPGRAGVITTFAWGVLAGRAWDRWMASWSPPTARAATIVILSLTGLDLWWTPQAVSYAVMIPHPPIQDRAVSPVYQWASSQPATVRLYAPGANLPTVLKLSAVPVYMGLGPQEYFDAEFTMPQGATDDFHTFTPERLAWLQQAGVTHVLAFEPLEPRGWPVDLVWTGFDPLLNRAWSRFDEPLWLYQLRNAPGRVAWENDNNPTATAKIIKESAQRVEIQAESGDEGRLVLKDLAYPGWQVEVNGVAAQAEISGGMFRAVQLPPGKSIVIWTYRPATVYWGLCLSGLASISLILGFGVLSRPPANR